VWGSQGCQWKGERAHRLLHKTYNPCHRWHEVSIWIRKTDQKLKFLFWNQEVPLQLLSNTNKNINFCWSEPAICKHCKHTNTQCCVATCWTLDQLRWWLVTSAISNCNQHRFTCHTSHSSKPRQSDNTETFQQKSNTSNLKRFKVDSLKHLVNVSWLKRSTRLYVDFHRSLCILICTRSVNAAIKQPTINQCSITTEQCKTRG